MNSVSTDKFRRLGVIGTLTIFVAACSDMPPYVAPEIHLADRYSTLAPEPRLSEESQEWWLSFNDPLLTRLVARAVADNPSLAEARSRLEEAEAQLRKARPAISGDLTLDVAHSSSSPDTLSADASASVGLFGRRTARIRAAAARLNAEQFGAADARRVLIAQLATAYVQLRFHQQSLRERHRDMTSRQATLREIQAQKNAGAATELDVVRARALVAEIEVDVPQTRAEIIRQRNRISTLLGVPVGLLDIDLNTGSGQPQVGSAGELGVPADLLRLRPDIRQAERLYAAAVSDLAESHANRYPRLNLSGILRAPLESGSSSQSLIAGLVIPLFSQPALAAEVDAAEARVIQAQLRWRQMVMTAVEEVETALAALEASRRASSSARDLVQLNERALNLTRRTMENGGDITVLDLLDRERTLTSARQVLASNRRDAAINYITLQSAIGLGSSLEVVPPDSAPAEQ